MRKGRFTGTQIIGMIKEQEAGMPTAEVCRRHGLSPATFYKLKFKYGGMHYLAGFYVAICREGTRNRIGFILRKSWASGDKRGASSARWP